MQKGIRFPVLIALTVFAGGSANAVTTQTAQRIVNQTAAKVGIPYIMASAFVVADQVTSPVIASAFKTRFAIAFAQRPHDMWGIVLKLRRGERRFVLRVVAQIRREQASEFARLRDQATSEAAILDQ